MKRFIGETGDLFVSQEEYKRYLSLETRDLEDEIEKLISIFFFNKPEFREYCELWAKKLGVKPYVILRAHGLEKTKGRYCDGSQVHSTQNWIYKRDGKYGTLLLGCCNSEQWIPTSRKSLVIFSNGDTKYSISTRNSPDENFNFELLHPKKGIIDSYVIEAELKELKELKEMAVRRK